MQFSQFKKMLQDNIAALLENKSTLFMADIDKDQLWALYLDSFPPGTNGVYRERREFDCSCCRQFIKAFGGVVVIENNRVVSIWDFQTGSGMYQPVVDALAAYVKSKPVRDVFVTKESGFGTDKNHEQLEDGSVITWEHYRVDLPSRFVTRSSKSEASLMGELRSTKQVFQRSQEEISQDAIDTVLDLIAQKSLYKGEEWEAVLGKFLALHRQYHALQDAEKDPFCWSKSIEVGGAIGRIRNHSIGVLLTDITQGMELNAAVRRYETIVAPSNYKRPKAIFTKKMLEQAQKTVMELGLKDSLSRRYAVIDDITVNNILFANRDTLKQMTGDVFEELAAEATAGKKQFDRLEEVPVDHFISHILPRATALEVYLENRHEPNLVSLIAPQVKDSPSMFKWGNNFSWAYAGNITDSLKERVKAAGGKVDGVLRFSIQWNDAGDNRDDLDAHCIEPNKHCIYFSNKGRRHPSSGMLDVDIIDPDRDQVAVENITYASLDKMPDGVYEFKVHCYSHRGGRSGFKAEVEFDGQIHSFEYNKPLRQSEYVTVAKVRYDKASGQFKVEKSLPSSLASKTLWNLPTNQFHPVSVCMFSPNYWDAQDGLGHRHCFFMLKNCVNDNSPNGFFNEFLREDLMPHKRVFEALGSKMRVADSEDQLSGLGFSVTKRNSVVCKVEGHVSRMLKVVF